jgi:flagellar biosynthesis GTPase FlhF
MGNEEIVKQLVKELKTNEKFEIIRNIPEKTLHFEIRELLTIMNPDSYIEVTHGTDEFGKDLVMVKKEPMGEMVYAMVVKTGDISSRASKEIAVIKDQVNEAFAHPAVLNGFEASGNLEVTYVYVIIAGQLSGNAMIRLKAEINNPIKRTNLQILDMDWLVTNFTKYYPYVFYEGEVSLYIESTIKQLEKKHLFSTRGIDLTEYYVEPEIAKLERIIELSDTDITLTLLRDRISFKQLEKEMQPGNKFLVVGDPGVGKTTALAKMGIDKMLEALKKATRSRRKRKY